MLTNKIFNASALMTPVIHIDHYRHPYRRPRSSIWMTKVNRYEVSIIYPSSIGPFSLK